MWPAFVKANDLDVSKITVVNLDANAMASSLLQGQIDAYASLAFAQNPILQAQGAQPSAILFADYGANTLSEGIIANQKTLIDEPDLVKRFLRASLKGYTYSMDHPDEAIADRQLKAFPAADPKVVLARLDEVLKEIKAGQTRASRSAGRPPRSGTRPSPSSRTTPTSKAPPQQRPTSPTTSCPAQ